MKPTQITLAIESAVAGGSLSLLDDGVEIDSWIGTSTVSKAEYLLANIDAILTRSKVSRHDIGLIAVAAGPGSFTGIRIGIATALGLKNGLGISMSSESALKAMVCGREIENKIVAAVPVGRGAVCFQRFDRHLAEVDIPQAENESKFLHAIKDEPETIFLLHANIYAKAGSLANVIDFGSNLARSIGLICRLNPGTVVEPIFISKKF
jgi:tRNA threonylcarbamoyladenosine biosynthesis protein TsaB